MSSLVNSTARNHAAANTVATEGLRPAQASDTLDLSNLRGPNPFNFEADIKTIRYSTNQDASSVAIKTPIKDGVADNKPETIAADKKEQNVFEQAQELMHKANKFCQEKIVAPIAAITETAREQLAVIWGETCRRCNEFKEKAGQTLQAWADVAKETIDAITTKAKEAYASAQAWIEEKRDFVANKIQEVAQGAQERIAALFSKPSADGDSPIAEKSLSGSKKSSRSRAASTSVAEYDNMFAFEMPTEVDDNPQTTEQAYESIRKYREIVEQALESTAACYEAIKEKKSKEEIAEHFEEIEKRAKEVNALRLSHPNPKLSGWIEHTLAILTDTVPDYMNPSSEALESMLEDEERRLGLSHQLDRAQRTLELLNDGITSSIDTPEKAA